MSRIMPGTPRYYEFIRLLKCKRHILLDAELVVAVVRTLDNRYYHFDSERWIPIDKSQVKQLTKNYNKVDQYKAFVA